LANPGGDAGRATSLAACSPAAAKQCRDSDRCVQRVGETERKAAITPPRAHPVPVILVSGAAGPDHLATVGDLVGPAADRDDRVGALREGLPASASADVAVESAPLPPVDTPASARIS